MTDETVIEGNSQGQGEQASQAQSSTPGSQPSTDVAALQAQVNELTKLFRGIQKGEDKINARVEERVKALTMPIERIMELAKSGKSQSEIEERLVLDEIIRERRSNGLPTPPEGTGGSGQGSVDVQGIAKQLNLDVNDKDIAAAVASGNLVTLMNVAISKAQTPSPSAEDAAPLTGGGSQSADLEAMYSRMEELSKNYSRNKPAILALQAKIKAAGG